MLYRIRRLLFTLILLFSLLLVWAAFTGRVNFFLSHATPADTLATAINLLSTLIESLAGVLGITIAVLFITAQVSTKSTHQRTLLELYNDYTTFITLALFFIAVISSLLSLGVIAFIIEEGKFNWLDFNIIISATAILLLIPLVLVQIENLDTYLLAVKLSNHITPPRILAYNLAQIEVDPRRPSRARYSLLVWGNIYGRDDPLGSIHETIMIAVHNRDRLMLSALIRLLLQRIAKYSGVPLAPKARFVISQPGYSNKGIDWLYLKLHRPANLKIRLAMTIHILHYVVRRGQNLRKKNEWGDLDAVRQQFILDIRDLILALNLRRGSEQCIDVCLFAVMHICLGYADMMRFGRYEALQYYFQLTDELLSSGKHEQAKLCVQILALLATRTRQIPSDLLARMEAQLAPPLRASYEIAILLSEDNAWTPKSDLDPWHDRLAGYRYPQINPP